MISLKRVMDCEWII